MAGEFYPTSILAGVQPGMQRNAQFAQPGPFHTLLGPEHMQIFNQWLEQIHRQQTPDYDMTGFFQAAMNHDPRAQTAVNPFDHLMHFTDTYKTPQHKSFSRESQYAKPNAPYWVDNKRLLDEKGKQIYEDK